MSIGWATFSVPPRLESSLNSEEGKGREGCCFLEGTGEGKRPGNRGM